MDDLTPEQIAQHYSAEDAKVQAVCAAVHTQDVIDAYAAHMEAQNV